MEEEYREMQLMKDKGRKAVYIKSLIAIKI